VVQSETSEESWRTELLESGELKGPSSSDGKKFHLLQGKELEDLFFKTLLTKLGVIRDRSKGVSSS